MALSMEYQALKKKKKISDVFTCPKSYNLFHASTICLHCMYLYLYINGAKSSSQQNRIHSNACVPLLPVSCQTEILIGLVHFD